MDVSHLLDALNAEQRQAVCGEHGHYLVLAGAGSGKTRVLVHRIAWLLEVDRVSPFAVLAVTFTNKAAGEMRARCEQLLDVPSRGLWVGTFHGIAHRLLRLHFREAGLPENFQIIDSDDQLRLIRRILRDQSVDEGMFPPRQMQWAINHHKENGRRAEDVDPGDNRRDQQTLAVYAEYERQCRRSGLADFAELLLRSHELWLEQPALLAHYQERFRHLLVDEFQDTNTIQYAWLRVLAGDSASVFVVGDDDQSIYGWRGARVEHVQKFQQDFANTHLVRLEQNYRSTSNILTAANALIANNPDRLGKNLWTEETGGDKVKIYAAYNEHDEAEFVIARIQEWLDEGQRADDSAILYRSHAQSRVFEEALLRRDIPYRVYGGLRFYERAEVKDSLGYLRLTVNRDDDAAFERVVNTPTRGIGERTVGMVRHQANADNSSLWQAAQKLITSQTMNGRARNALAGFLSLIDALEHDLVDKDLGDQLQFAIEASGLIEHYEKEPAEKAQTRRENMAELINAGRYFKPGEDQAELPELSAFLAHAALEAGEGQAAQWEDCVQMMTLHSAKGLEFPLVFLAGLEDGVFPHERSLESSDRLQEERRLCYVGITRARQHLYLSFAETRRMHGRDHRRQASRFLSELPMDVVEEIRPRIAVSRPGLGYQQPAPDIGDLGLGDAVSHHRFGVGVVLDCEGMGPSTRIQVHFEDHGAKWLVLSHASLERL
ncbi:MAG: DNA helicase [Lysobacteraceae bacterium]|nr:MAG: DNA helicase [Xanthomonadaceae bacterium]